MSFEECWSRLLSLQGVVFHTARGMPFTYTIHGGVMRVDRKSNPITKATVELAYKTAVEADGEVPGPKSLRCFGSSYLYAVFQAIGIITTQSRVDNKKNDTIEEDKTMPRPKGSKNKPALTIDEQMEKITAEISALKDQIAEKEAELVRLKNLKDEEAMKELMAAMAASGKSVSDVIALIKATEGEV